MKLITATHFWFALHTKNFHTSLFVRCFKILTLVALQLFDLSLEDDQLRESSDKHTDNISQRDGKRRARAKAQTLRQSIRRLADMGCNRCIRDIADPVHTSENKFADGKQTGLYVSV